MRNRAESRLKWAVAILAVATLAAFASPCRAAPVAVLLHDEAVVAAGPVTLGQLADIEPGSETSSQIAAVIIGTSPLPGHQRTITAGYVRMRMARAGIGSDTASLTGAAAVVVRVAAEKAVRPQVAAAQPSTQRLHYDKRFGQAGMPVLQTAEGNGKSWSCKRGQKVQIRVLCGNIVVLTSGQLLENATAWEPVTARVQSTGGKVFGVLSGPRELTVKL